MVIGHPLRENGTAAAHDSGDAFGNHGQVLDKHAGVDGHIVHTLGGLLFDDFQHDVGVEIFNALHAGDCFVNGHGTDRDRRVAQYGFTNFMNIAAGGEIHDRIGAVVHGGVKFFQFLINI